MITLNTVYNIFLFDENISLEYVLGLINSRLMRYFWQKKYFDNKLTFPKIKKNPLESIPIAEKNCNNSLQIIKKVNSILSLKKENCFSDTTMIETEIDQLVYELYGLTEDEIKIVENK